MAMTCTESTENLLTRDYKQLIKVWMRKNLWEISSHQSDYGLNIGSLIMYSYISSVSIFSFKEYPSVDLNQFTQCWKQLFETHEIDWNVCSFACKLCAFSRVIQISIQRINVIREDKGYQISSQEGLTCLQVCTNQF